MVQYHEQHSSTVQEQAYRGRRCVSRQEELLSRGGGRGEMVELKDCQQQETEGKL